MYEVLVYLYEHCQRTDLSHDNQMITKRLSAAGFEDTDISEALSWLAGVCVSAHRGGKPMPDTSRGVRAYAGRECEKLDAECRGYIMNLEHIGLLAPELRELVVDRAMAAAGGALSLDQLRLIVMMVLWNLEPPESRLFVEDLLAPAQNRLPH